MSSNDLFEILSIMIGHNRLAKVTHFSQKNLTIGQMGSSDQIVVNVCNFVSHDHCKDIYEILGSIMGCNWYINFTFAKKILFGKNLAICTQPRLRLSYLISHDIIYIF